MAPELDALHGRLVTAAVTGTNGKTTTVSMIASIVAAAGETPARLTTLGAWVGDEPIEGGKTMATFERTVERAVERGVRTLALETTSKALANGFATRWPAKVAAFTNLARDHLDRHRTPAAYLAAKAQLFLALPADGVAVLNAGDPASALLDSVTPAGVRRRGYAAPGAGGATGLPIDLAASGVDVGRDGTHVRLSGPFGPALGGELHLRVIGAVHAENALAAALAADALGYPAAAVRAGLEQFAGVPGRFEVVSERPLVVVDYAHTPDALERTLVTARALAGAGRLVCVFGCGGNRDRGKRPLMGGVADRLADLVVLTTDNPRGEEPAAIADAVADGAGGRATWRRELDRARAIGAAIADARDDDVVVIAGKGHERMQLIGGEERPFSDAEVAVACCRTLPDSGSPERGRS